MQTRHTGDVEVVAKWTFWSVESEVTSIRRSVSDSMLCSMISAEDDDDCCSSHCGDVASVTTASGETSDCESTCDRESHLETTSSAGSVSRWADVVDNDEPHQSTGMEHDRATEKSCDNNSHLTTIMLRNIPKTFTRQSFTLLMDEQGFMGCYDFVHVPLNLQSHGTESVGYALVNAVCHEHGEHLLQYFNGFELSPGEFCEATWSNTCQGLLAHIEKYRNSAVMHESVPAEHKPAVYHLGQWMPFPEPTRAIRAPRVRHAKNK